MPADKPFTSCVPVLSLWGTLFSSLPCDTDGDLAFPVGEARLRPDLGLIFGTFGTGGTFLGLFDCLGAVVRVGAALRAVVVGVEDLALDADPGREEII